VQLVFEGHLLCVKYGRQELLRSTVKSYLQLTGFIAFCYWSHYKC